MSAKISAGTLEVPEGWEVSTEIRVIEPAGEAIAAPLRGKKPSERSRAGVTVSRYASEHADADAALNAFLKRLAIHTQSMKRIGEGDLEFEDGVGGKYVIVTYELGPGRAVAQCHAYRVDAMITSHLTASVDVFHAGRIEAELLRVLRTFRAD